MFSALTGATLQAAPVHVPEAPARVFRTGLELPDRLATTYAWLDERHLAVTATPKGGDNSYSGLRRVVAVDSRTGAHKTLLERGFLSCTNPHTGVVGAYVGDLRKMLRGGDAPQPVLTWFHWDAKQVLLEERPLAKGQTIHSQHCRTYEPEQDLNGQVMTGVAPVRYLEPGHGQIRWRYDFESRKSVDVHWENGGRRRALDLPAESISAFVEWLPYRSAYLLSPGLYDHRQYQQPKVLQLTTMDSQGRLSRQTLPQEAMQSLKQVQVGQIFVAPMRDGMLLVLPGRSDEGAGLYRHSQKGGLQRLFCARPPNHATGSDSLSEHCLRDEPVKVSPDGCSAAFVSRYDFDGSFPQMSLQGQVHLLDLCNRAQR